MLFQCERGGNSGWLVCTLGPSCQTRPDHGSWSLASQRLCNQWLCRKKKKKVYKPKCTRFAPSSNSIQYTLVTGKKCDCLVSKNTCSQLYGCYITTHKADIGCFCLPVPVKGSEGLCTAAPWEQQSTEPGIIISNNPPQ